MLALQNRLLIKSGTPAGRRYCFSVVRTKQGMPIIFDHVIRIAPQAHVSDVLYDTLLERARYARV